MDVFEARAAAVLIVVECRQEVETDQFYNFFLPELKQDGYDGIFSPKSRAKTMGESERKYVDGCAIFFRSAKRLRSTLYCRFALVKEHLIEFNQLAMANSEGSDNMLNRVMPKDNIGLAALIKTKEAAWENGLPTDSSMLGQPILVCTAHIHWDPEFCDVKLIQTMMLSNELRTILDESARSLRLAGQRDNVQLLLCGDFNSLPDSGVVEFLSSGRVSSEHRDFKELGYAGSLRRMPGSEHEFDFKGIIDYIFYSKQSMTPLGLLGPLSQDWFREHKVVGCPHPHIPSVRSRSDSKCVNVNNVPCCRPLPAAGGAGDVSDGERQLQRAHRAQVARVAARAQAQAAQRRVAHHPPRPTPPRAFGLLPILHSTSVHLMLPLY
ncbi:hypothetical protein HF086_008408 [Spodoptera exigua]|uniref:Endonuclease/exonuclease/phosphatase domain-containing protein n=1 Tax=Spodoptera exigua TaxID=7107 RepID=A0A922SGJ2_SPOEX|nr:hypothetical protein HF086_008408 [Spodoptera exigua]